MKKPLLDSYLPTFLSITPLGLQKSDGKYQRRNHFGCQLYHISCRVLHPACYALLCIAVDDEKQNLSPNISVLSGFLSSNLFFSSHFSFLDIAIAQSSNNFYVRKSVFCSMRGFNALTVQMILLKYPTP